MLGKFDHGTVFILTLFCSQLTQVSMQYCHMDYSGEQDEYRTFSCLQNECGSAIEDQVTQALSVAFNNLFLGAYFDQSTVQKPGLAKFFYESSSAARHHAMDILDFLNNRSYPIETNFQLHVEKSDPGDFTFRMGLSQLLNTEISVLNRIQTLVEKCQGDFDVGEKLVLPSVRKQHSIINQLKRLLSNIDHVKSDESNPTDEHIDEYIMDLKLLKGLDI